MANEHHAAASLERLLSAEEVFRDKDLDGNGVDDYWRGDVAGLFALRDAEDLDSREERLAAADAAPLTGNEFEPEPVPLSNYYFRSIGFADEATPDPQRFAFCAYPANFEDNHVVLIIDHENRLFGKRFEPGDPLPTVFPEDPLAEGWSGGVK